MAGEFEFRVTIRLGNDAMQTGADVAGALRAIAEGLAEDYEPLGPSHAASILDMNGNRVGQFKIREV